MPYVIRPEERSSFKRCRRAWDLGSRSRQNYQPVDRPVGAGGFDLGEAIRDALAIYYFPGMWEWNRQIVLPLVRDAFTKSVERQRRRAGLRSEAEEADLEAARALGLRMLDGYFEWAPSVDRFWPVRVETDFGVQVPDPWRAGHDLALPSVGPIRYEGRIPMLVVDEADTYWLVDHRVVRGDWVTLDELVLDERGVSFCWAWELFYMGMRIAGTVYNELRADVATDADVAPGAGGLPPATETAGAAGTGAQHRRMYAQARQEPVQGIAREAHSAFRRTRIPRSRAELDHAGRLLAWEALEMVDAGLPCYPSPSPDYCPSCLYRQPCIAMNTGADAEAILAASYRKRPPEEVEEGRLGGVTWSMSRGAMPLTSRARQPAPGRGPGHHNRKDGSDDP